MQTDIWLTESAQPARCPLCSKPLRASSKTCYACGFSLESPRMMVTGSSVWIDPAVYTYPPPEAASPDTRPSDRSQIATNPPSPLNAPKPTGSVIWEGDTHAQPQSQTRQHTGGMNNLSPGKHSSPNNKSIAKPVHNRRRTYTRSLSQTQESNLSTRSVAPQSPMWQYESPNFEAGSSLPALSLLIAETPTQPGITLPELEAAGTVETTGAVGTGGDIELQPDNDSSWLTAHKGLPLPGGHLFASSLVEPSIPYAPYAYVDEVDTIPELNQVSSRTLNSQQAAYARVDEIDTVPELSQIPGRELDASHTSYARVDEIDTVPEMNQAPVRALVPVNPQVATITTTGLSSWTAGGGTQSTYARRVADRSRRKKRRSTLSFNPLDQVRWWLLRPGRIEFMLWLGGTILLISITCVLLLVTAFSLNWITPGLRSGITSSTSSLPSASPQGHVLPTITGTPGLVFTLLDKGLLLPGQSLHVHGQGFTPNGRVVFTLDGTQLSLNANAPPASVRSDRHGEFNATLALGYGPAWNPGPHLIIARDVKTERLAVLSFMVVPGPFGKGATATPAPVTPGATVTPTPGKPQGSPTPNPTPVGQPQKTPTPNPTASVTPSPTPAPPTPTPTVGITPTPTKGITPTPTVGTSPTAGVNASPSPTHTAAVPLSSTSSGDEGAGGNLSSALGNSNTPALDAQLTRLAPWLWMSMLLSILAMVMLGVAGVLHKRRG